MSGAARYERAAPLPENAMPTINPADIRKIIFPQGGSYLWGALSGPSNAKKRQAVMAALGINLPKSKCGFTLVFTEMAKAAGSEETRHVSTSERIVQDWLAS